MNVLSSLRKTTAALVCLITTLTLLPTGQTLSVSAAPSSSPVSTIILPESGQVQITVNNALNNSCNGDFGIQSPGGPTVLFHDYNDDRGNSIILDPTYPENTELVFFIEPHSYCSTPTSHYLSTNPETAHILQIAYGIWRIDWEDLPFETTSLPDYDDFIVTVRLTSAFPDDKQTDPQWSDELYDHTAEPIGSAGSALTGMTNLLIFDGAHDATPSSVNTWLKNNAGYASTGKINWGAFERYKPGSDQVTLLDYVRLITAENPSFNLADEITASLDDSRPVILQLDLGGALGTHFVAAFAMDRTNPGNPRYIIKDPAGTTDAPGITRLAPGDPRIIAARFFKPADAVTCPTSSDLSIYSNPSVRLLLTDNYGRRVGIEGSTGTAYREIPDSDEIYDPPMWFPDGSPNSDQVGEGHELFIPCIPLGVYHLTVYPVQTGLYRAQIYLHNQDNLVEQTIQATAYSTLPHTFDLTITEAGLDIYTLWPTYLPLIEK